MNHIYSLVWNSTTQRYVPAPETARGRGMGGAATLVLAPVLLLGALLASPAGAQTLPTREKLVFGEASVQRKGSQMTIDQKSAKVLLDWTSFSIGQGATVEFKQPVGGVALNRVQGKTASQIDGQLKANSQVWLVNPNGVVFGSNSQVNVGGLIASTLRMNKNDFVAGKQVFTHHGMAGGITVHKGAEIEVNGGGTLALLAPQVNNEGTLRAQMGNVVLAGGEQVTLQAGADGRLDVAVSPSEISTLIENKELIVADGGQVIMTAKAADALSGSVVSNQGTVQAHTLLEKEGRILLQADMQHGKVVHAGLLNASAPVRGHGGQVRTSAATVSMAPDATVRTAANQGATGHWVIDQAKDLHIDPIFAHPAPDISATMLRASLDHTHITLKTQGDLRVNASLRYGRHQLALDAGKNIVIDRPISVEGEGTLQLNYGGTAGNAQVRPADGSKLDILKSVDFAKTGTHLLKINGHRYAVIDSLQVLQDIGVGRPGNGNYALGRSIDGHGVDFEPLGALPKTRFEGSIEGLGHAIQNLTINRPGQEDGGIFGRGGNAWWRNTKLQKVRVKSNLDASGQVGSPAAHGGAAGSANVPALPAAAQPLPADALPTGFDLRAGKAVMRQEGSRMIVDQSTPITLVKWQGFDIGREASVHFNQPDVHSLAINWVTAGSASQIHGKLGANGQVWLISPDGVVFGHDGKVNVGGLVASTLKLSKMDPMTVFTGVDRMGGIANHGEITATGGDQGVGFVGLFSPMVHNEGIIHARLGSVLLLGGDQISQEIGKAPVIGLPSTVRTLIENKGKILADGGMVAMMANVVEPLRAVGVSNTGTIQTQTLGEKRGVIELGATGKVVHTGLLDASAPTQGDGGQVKTTAETVCIGIDAKVNTAATQGKTGNWVIDQATDLHISPIFFPKSDINTAMVRANLDDTNITLNTKGDLYVSGNTRHGRNQLTLNADQNIFVKRPVSIGGEGTLQLNYGGTAGDAQIDPAKGSNLHVFQPVDFSQPSNQLLKINGHRYAVINSLEELQDIGVGRPANGNYALGRSIDAQGVDFKPIGATPGYQFKGNFDGLGHTIRNLTINRPPYKLARPIDNLDLDSKVEVLVETARECIKSDFKKYPEAAGLFGHTWNANLRNVKLDDVSVKGDNSVGGLVGDFTASRKVAGISNVQVNGEVSGNHKVGGLVGRNDALDKGTSSISSASFTGKVSGKQAVGAIAGFNASADSESKATITNVHAISEVLGTSGNASLRASRNLEAIGALVGAQIGVTGGTSSLSAASFKGMGASVSNTQLVGHLESAGGVASISDSKVILPNGSETRIEDVFDGPGRIVNIGLMRNIRTDDSLAFKGIQDLAGATPEALAPFRRPDGLHGDTHRPAPAPAPAPAQHPMAAPAAAGPEPLLDVLKYD